MLNKKRHCDCGEYDEAFENIARKEKKGVRCDIRQAKMVLFHIIIGNP